MKAMILAAGRGERMRPLTDHTPKPLLSVAGKPLIEHHLLRLSEQGFNEVVINVSHLGQQIVDYCGNGERWQLAIHYSREDEPLETAGGIVRALPLLGSEPFLIVNGDIWTDISFDRLRDKPLRQGEVARLVMVDSPPQHAQGDFALDHEGFLGVRSGDEVGLTYAGVGLYSPGLFEGVSAQKLALRPLLDAAIARRSLGGLKHTGDWEDVGTPQRLQALDERLGYG